MQPCCCPPPRSGKLNRGLTNDRAMFLKVVGKSLPGKMNAEELERIAKEVEERMGLTKLGVMMSAPVPLGVLDTDDVAIYQGMLMQAGTEENMETVAAVIAITLVGHYNRVLQHVPDLRGLEHDFSDARRGPADCSHHGEREGADGSGMKIICLVDSGIKTRARVSSWNLSGSEQHETRRHP